MSQVTQGHWLPHLGSRVFIPSHRSSPADNIHMSPAVYGLLLASSHTWISYRTSATSASSWLDKGLTLCVSCVWDQLCWAHEGRGGWGAVALTYAWGSGFPADHWFDSPCEITTLEICLIYAWEKKKHPHIENIYVYVLFFRIHLHLYQLSIFTLLSNFFLVCTRLFASCLGVSSDLAVVADCGYQPSCFFCSC